METPVTLDRTFADEIVRRMESYRIWIFLAHLGRLSRFLFPPGGPGGCQYRNRQGPCHSPGGPGLHGFHVFLGICSGDASGRRSGRHMGIAQDNVGIYPGRSAGQFYLRTCAECRIPGDRQVSGRLRGGLHLCACRPDLADWYRPDELATYSGILLAVGNIGALISAAPLVALMAVIGWRNCFHVVGIFTLMAALFTWIVVRNKPTDLNFPTPRDLMGLPPAPPAPQGQAWLGGEGRFCQSAVLSARGASVSPITGPSWA